MSSVQSLRDFISQRLTAAAAEIFTEFEKTIVQYEEEIDRQRRLLDITWRPELKLQRTDLQQDLIFREDDEDDGPDQQLCNQDRNSSLDQKQPEPPQIKEELEEEQLVLKQESEVVMVTPASDGSGYNEPEPRMDQLLFQAEDQDQEETNHEDSESSRTEDRTPEKSHNSYNVDDSSMSEAHCNADAGNQSVNCDICGKLFPNRYLMRSHKRIHTGDRLHSCGVCCKTFTRSDSLMVHMRTHTGEKPHSCTVCGKRFGSRQHLTYHTRTHTGEKPYSCKVCHKSFTRSYGLSVHMRTHTGERPYSCKICGRSFSKSSDLLVHMRRHTGEKPYSCQICGKSFSHNFSLTVHKRKSCM